PLTGLQSPWLPLVSMTALDYNPSWRISFVDLCSDKNKQQNTPPNLFCHTPLSTITHSQSSCVHSSSDSCFIQRRQKTDRVGGEVGSISDASSLLFAKTSNHR
uniref:hypothetical protein n=1 Tax=Legionella birminghamensis TaxID=28083 RepID=UPI001A93B6ED